MCKALLYYSHVYYCSDWNTCQPTKMAQKTTLCTVWLMGKYSDIVLWAHGSLMTYESALSLSLSAVRSWTQRPGGQWENRQWLSARPSNTPLLVSTLCWYLVYSFTTTIASNSNSMTWQRAMHEQFGRVSFTLERLVFFCHPVFFYLFLTISYCPSTRYHVYS